jgi:hypothetical protein
VVARYQGLLAAIGFQGLTRWALAADGSVQAATIFLDRDYEKSPNATLGPLRAHELGHALGCAHVSGRASVMNAFATTEPNEWDRQAGTIAFQRPPGNRAPDTDPESFSANSRDDHPSPALVWGTPVP